MSQQIAPKQSPLLVFCTTRDYPDFFSSIGLSVDHATTVPEVTTKLESTTYSGLCVISTASEVETLKSFFSEIENKSMLEGLRSVLVITRSSSAMKDPLYRVFDKPWLHQYGLSAFRDIIDVAKPVSPTDKDEVSKRIAFAIQYNAKNPFSNRMTSVVRYKARAEVTLPARLSWFLEHTNHIGIECGIQMPAGSKVKFRTEAGSGIGHVVLRGMVKENLPSQLRFNHGNSISIELENESAQIFKRAIYNDSSGTLVTKPVRRAFIVTRSLALRQRVIRVFSRHVIDSRVPLVKRNILSDLPLLNPHYVLIEDRVLTELMERDGPDILEKIAKAAGKQAFLAVIGDDPGALLQNASGWSSIALKPLLDQNVANWLAKVDQNVSKEVEDKRVWISHSARLSFGALSFEERIHQLGPDGVIFRGSNHFRMWGNVEVCFPGTKMQFIGKTTTSLLACDTFRTKHPTVSADNVIHTFISAITSTAELARAAVVGFEETLSLLGVTREPAKAPAESLKIREAVVAESAPISARQKKVARTGPIYLGLILLTIGVLIYVMLQIESGGASFARSFRDLFSNHGK